CKYYRPKVIIAGLCLRDFLQDEYAAEWRCDSFNSIAPYVPVSSEVLRRLTSRRAAQEFLLDHFWYLYRNRQDFQNIMVAFVKDSLEFLPLDQPFERFSQPYVMEPAKKGYLLETW